MPEAPRSGGSRRRLSLTVPSTVAPELSTIAARQLSEGYRILTIGLRDKVPVTLDLKARQSARASRDKVPVDNSNYPQRIGWQPSIRA